MMIFEKAEEGPRGITSARKQPSKRKRIVTAVLVVLAFIWLTHSNIIAISHPELPYQTAGFDPTAGFDWDTIETKPRLHYETCYERLQCARLELPMDWFNETTNATISLAVIRQPAAVPVSHPQYGGAILRYGLESSCSIERTSANMPTVSSHPVHIKALTVNPGGPGGSGVGLILWSGEHARSIVDANTTDGKYFDLISFDPRGVGLSKPRVDCFHDPTLAAGWQQRVQEEGWFEFSDASLGRLWSMSTAKGHSCSMNSSTDTGDDIKKYVSTAYAARDMLELVERHGQWREREARNLLHGARPRWTRLLPGCRKELEVPGRLRYRHGEEKIQYYGVSYGSYLGGTFAAMFPDRVERLVVDGVIEYDNYMSGNWSSNLIDTEKAMDSFYFHCARAGYPACALANQTGASTPPEIRKRTSDIVQSLYHNPLPVYTPSAEVLSYSEVKSLIFGSLYAPVLVFPMLAEFLLAIEQKDSCMLAPYVRFLHPSTCAVDSMLAIAAASQDATVAIACSDGDDQSYVSRSKFQAFAKELAAMSPTSGSIWSMIRMNCVHYTLPAVHRFKGPWKANTSHPLLFVGNTADPVTPGLYAREMAKGFEGAVALMQDSGGHCSDAAFSFCTTGYLRKYFQTGELPPANTTCAADLVPFGATPGGNLTVESMELKAGRESWEKMAKASLKHGAIPGGQVWHAVHEKHGG